MRTLLTTDTHFGHTELTDTFNARPADFCDRIRARWLHDVREDDLVIHLGDVMVARADQWDNYIPTLPGRKVLVRGNHDRKSAMWYMEHGFDFACDQFTLNLFGLRLLFTHEPVHGDHFDLNIHGHCHAEDHREGIDDGQHYLLALENTHYNVMSLRHLVNVWRREDSTRSLI